MDSYNQLVSRNYLSVFFHKIQLIFLNNIGDLPPYKKEIKKEDEDVVLTRKQNRMLKRVFKYLIFPIVFLYFVFDEMVRRFLLKES
jgi:hypothetical protein